MYEDCRDKLHSYFADNREWFQTIYYQSKNDIRTIMARHAAYETGCSLEESMEYVDELMDKWWTYLHPVYH